LADEVEGEEDLVALHNDISEFIDHIKEVLHKEVELF